MIAHLLRTQSREDLKVKTKRESQKKELEFFARRVLSTMHTLYELTDEKYVLLVVVRGKQVLRA